MEDHVRSFLIESIGDGLGCGRIIKTSGVIDKDIDIRIHILRACPVPCCELIDQRVVHTSDEADSIAV